MKKILVIIAVMLFCFALNVDAQVRECRGAWKPIDGSQGKIIYCTNPPRDGNERTFYYYLKNIDDKRISGRIEFIVSEKKGTNKWGEQFNLKPGQLDDGGGMWAVGYDIVSAKIVNIKFEGKNISKTDRTPSGLVFDVCDDIREYERKRDICDADWKKFCKQAYPVDEAKRKDCECNYMADCTQRLRGELRKARRCADGKKCVKGQCE